MTISCIEEWTSSRFLFVAEWHVESREAASLARWLFMHIIQLRPKGSENQPCIRHQTVSWTIRHLMCAFVWYWMRDWFFQKITFFSKQRWHKFFKVKRREWQSLLFGRLRKWDPAERLTWSHAASKWQRQGSNPEVLIFSASVATEPLVS